MQAPSSYRARLQMSYRKLYIQSTKTWMSGPNPALIFKVKCQSGQLYKDFLHFCHKNNVHYFPIEEPMEYPIGTPDKHGNYPCKEQRVQLFECVHTSWGPLQELAECRFIADWWELTSFRPPAMARNRADLDHSIPADSKRLKTAIIRHGWSQRRLNQTEERERLEKLAYSNPDSPHYGEPLRIAQRKAYDYLATGKLAEWVDYSDETAGKVYERLVKFYLRYDRAPETTEEKEATF
jgi:hypothetical protein